MNEVPHPSCGPATSLPSLSIAMAVFNGSRFVEKQLDSFASQTVPPDELVVLDDASTDETPDLVQAFAHRAPFPVRFERNPQNLGFKANFLKAASLCKSELIAFSDHDDVWLPRKIEVCRNAFAKRDILLTYHDATVVTDKLEPIGAHNHSPPPALNPPQSLDPWLFTGGFSMVFHRSLLRFNDLWPCSTDYYQSDRLDPHDQWIFFLASCLGKIRFIPEPLVLYRQHRANTIGWIRPTKGLRSSWQNVMSTQTTSFKSRELAAEKRAMLMEQIQLRVEGDEARLASQAAHKYYALASIYRLRQETYAADNLGAKLRGLMSTVRAGGYKPKNEWGVGKKALVRDLIRGVLLPIKQADVAIA